MKSVWPVIFFIIFLFTPVADAAETVVREIKVDGRERMYRLHVPDTYEEAPVPLVMVFHGGGGKAGRFETVTRFSVLSEQHGFIVVYPEAIDGHWNDGRVSEQFAEHDRTIDDVAFVMAMIRELKRMYAIDDGRIYATGASNGGMFSQRLAVEHTETFAAVATMIGSMPEDLKSRFKPSKPISVMIINGTEDPFVPYDGGTVTPYAFPRLARLRGAPDRGRVLSTDETIDLWIKHNGANGPKITAEVADIDTEDDAKTEIHTWTGGASNTSVVLYKVVGGGHTIPGGPQYLPARIIGNVCMDFSAAEAIWLFFKHMGRR